MKHKETFIAILLFVVFIMFCFGCSTKKELTKEQNQEYNFKSYQNAKDENIMEYTIDTSKVCETEILVESIEFFNDADSLTHEQRIKTITRKTIVNKKTDSGKTEIKTIDKNENETIVSVDSAKYEKNQQSTERKTETKSIFQCVWLWLIIIAAFILLYIRYKILK